MRTGLYSTLSRAANDEYSWSAYIEMFLIRIPKMRLWNDFITDRYFQRKILFNFVIIKIKKFLKFRCGAGDMQ